MDEVGIGQWPVFFAVQFVFQFCMFDAERGYMTAIHLILLIMRLDDLVSGVNHETLPVSAFILDETTGMRCTTRFWR